MDQSQWKPAAQYLPRPGRLLQSQIEAEDRHPGTETERNQGEEEDHQDHSRHPLGEEGHRPDGGQQPEMGGINGQIEKYHYIASETFLAPGILPTRLEWGREKIVFLFFFTQKKT